MHINLDDLINVFSGCNEISILHALYLFFREVGDFELMDPSISNRGEFWTEMRKKKKKRRQDDTLDNFKYDVVCRDYHYFFAFNCIRHDAIKTEKFLNLLIDFYSNHQLVLRSHYHKLLRLDVHSVIRPSQRRTISHFG